MRSDTNEVPASGVQTGTPSLPTTPRKAGGREKRLHVVLPFVCMQWGIGPHWAHVHDPCVYTAMVRCRVSAWCLAIDKRDSCGDAETCRRLVAMLHGASSLARRPAKTLRCTQHTPLRQPGSAA